MLFSFVRLLGRLWQASRKQAPSRKPRRRTSLQVEQLETRWVPAVISGYVFNDLNADGVMQAGEPGVKVGNQTGGQTVQLQDSTGSVLGTTQTGADGSYSFNVNPATKSTPAQSYTFADALTGVTQTSPPPQNGQQAVSQFDPSLGTLLSITISVNAHINIDPTVQNLEPDPRTIKAAVAGSVDVTANGVSVPSPTALQANLPDYNATGIDAVPHDYGNQLLSGTSSLTVTDPTALQSFLGTGTVTLKTKANATLTWPQGQPGNVNSGSSASGGASVTITYNYAPATSQYKVVLVQNPPGYTAGPWTPTNGQELTTPTGQEAIGVTVNNNSDTKNNNNFSFYQSASIQGTVYNDANNDGMQDNGEQAINGSTTPVTVTLQGPDSTQTQVLGADGTYSFNGLKPGNYNVSVTTPPGFIAGVANNAEVPPATANSIQYSNITLNSGVAGSNFNFGVYQGGSLSGHIYDDSGATPVGLSNIPVTLTNAVTGATVGTTTTDSTGGYSFGNLAIGNYTITKGPAVAPLANEKKVAGNLGVDTSRATPPTADQFFVNLGTPASNKSVGTGYDYYENAGTIRGTVYNDANNDGMQDNGEQVINGSTTPITVTLQGPSGTRTTQVASDGTYSFANLGPGTYSIQITTPNGYVPGLANSMENPQAVATSTQYSNIVLGGGASGTNFNFGIYQGGALSGHIFQDNGSSTTGLSGIKVTLTNALTGQVVATATTDANGAYQFSQSLPAGNYTITKDPAVAPLANEKKVAGNLGVDTNRGTTPTADQFFVNLGTPASGLNVGTGYDYYEHAGTISGTIYNDANNDGSQDNGEQVINGSTTPVTITLQGPAGTQTTQVANDGTYSFANLGPGTYSVKITTPSGYIPGVANNAETPQATATSTQYSNIVLGGGAQGTNFNFGIYQSGMLSGHVFLDAGGITSGLGGIKVTLTNAVTGQVVATTTTDDSGAYLFNQNLAIGSYTITKDPPAQGLSNEKKVPGSLGVDTSRTTTATADQFFVKLGSPASGQNVGTDYDFFEDIALPPPPPLLIPPLPPPPGFFKYWAVG